MNIVQVFKRFPVRFMALIFLALTLTACSKTVKWEEEVLLNTGETIWVRRQVRYTYRSNATNPLMYSLKPEWKKHIYFDYRGKSYHYFGDASLMVLAISPKGMPVLVAPASFNGWANESRYLCTVPFYVQLIPKENGEEWYWPPSIEPWLYGLKTNLLRDFSMLDSDKRKLTIEDIDGQHKREGKVSDFLRFVKQDYESKNCSKFFQNK